MRVRNHVIFARGAPAHPNYLTERMARLPVLALREADRDKRKEKTNEHSSHTDDRAAPRQP